MANLREQNSPELRGFGIYSNVRRRLPGATASPHSRAPGPASRRYALVRQERIIVGPTTAPYPILHETQITSSDSVVELGRLRDRIARGTPSSSGTPLPRPESWIDSVPGEKVYTYQIRKV